MLARMALAARLRDLDRRVLREHSLGARQAWARRYGWWLLLLVGVPLVLFGAWALAADRPALAVVPGAFGVGLTAVGVVLFTQRTRA